MLAVSGVLVDSGTFDERANISCISSGWKENTGSRVGSKGLLLSIGSIVSSVMSTGCNVGSTGSSVGSTGFKVSGAGSELTDSSENVGIG